MQFNEKLWGTFLKFTVLLELILDKRDFLSQISQMSNFDLSETTV